MRSDQGAPGLPRRASFLCPWLFSTAEAHTSNSPSSGQARALVLRRRRRGRTRLAAAVLRWGLREREGERGVEVGTSTLGSRL